MKLGLGQTLLRAAALGTAPAPVLDQVSVAAETAYSCFRLLIESYFGNPLLQVRRVSDSAVMDIGHDPSTGRLLTNDIIAFCGASDGRVSVLYNQIGGGGDLTVAAGDEAQQPLIHTGGLGVIVDPVFTDQPAMFFDHDDSGFDAPYLRGGVGVNTLDPNLTRLVTYRPAAGASPGRFVYSHPTSTNLCFLAAENASNGAEVGLDNGVYNITETANLNDSGKRYTIGVEYNNTSQSIKLYSDAVDISEIAASAASISSKDWTSVELGAPPNESEGSAFLGYIQEYMVFYAIPTAADRDLLLPPGASHSYYYLTEGGDRMLTEAGDLMVLER